MIGAIVPTYNPDEGLEVRLREISQQTDRLYLVDDGSSPEVLPRIRAVAQRLGCQLIENAGNLGVATAFNRGAAAARRDGCDHVLLLDQDTCVEADMTRRMTAMLAHASDPRIAVLAANYLDTGGRRAYRMSPDREISDVTIAISSGSLIPTALYHSLGGMDESLFIDEVDHDFCLRARLRGYRVTATREPLTRHQIGGQKLFRVAGVTFSMSNHGPLRRYYMARNRVVMTRRYLRHFPSWVLAMLLRSAVEVSLLPFLEPHGLQKLRAVARGLAHGLVGRRGRLDSASG
jgi:rhamnosyltransferase